MIEAKINETGQKKGGARELKKTNKNRVHPHTVDCEITRLAQRWLRTQSAICAALFNERALRIVVARWVCVLGFSDVPYTFFDVQKDDSCKRYEEVVAPWRRTPHLWRCDRVAVERR